MAKKQRLRKKAARNRKGYKRVKRPSPSRSRAISGHTIFTVQNEDLERLGPEEAVDSIRELLWAEARRIGLPTTSVNISTWVDVPDGGIDASVEADTSTLKGSFIEPGRNGYQIKASAAFQPWNQSHISKELFGQKGTPKKENLGRSVAKCLDDNGTYILVCTKADLPDAQQQKAVDLIKKHFGDCGLASWSVVSTFPYLDSVRRDADAVWTSRYSGLQSAFREAIASAPGPVVQAWPEVVSHVFGG